MGDKVGGHTHLTGTLVSVLESLLENALEGLESLWTTRHGLKERIND